jgi:hypothetical protein
VIVEVAEAPNIDEAAVEAKRGFRDRLVRSVEDNDFLL